MIELLLINAVHAGGAQFLRYSKAAFHLVCSYAGVLLLVPLASMATVCPFPRCFYQLLCVSCALAVVL